MYDIPSGLAGILSFFLILLGVVLTKGVDAWMKIRTGKLKELEYEDAKSMAGYKLAIDEFRVRIEHFSNELSQTREALKESRVGHADCIKTTAELRVANATQEQRINYLEEELTSLRKWRHSLEETHIIEHKTGLLTPKKHDEETDE